MISEITMSIIETYGRNQSGNFKTYSGNQC